MMRSTLLAVGLLSHLSAAETLHVPEEYPTIREALEGANLGDTIQVAAGTFYESNLLATNIEIKGTVGNQGEPLTVIDSEGMPGFSVSGDHFFLKDVRLENSSDFWAIDCAQVRSVELNNCELNAKRGFRVVGGSGLFLVTGCLFNNNQGQSYANRAGQTIYTDCGIEDYQYLTLETGSSNNSVIQNISVSKSIKSLGYNGASPRFENIKKVHPSALITLKAYGWSGDITVKDSIASSLILESLTESGSALITDCQFDSLQPEQANLANVILNYNQPNTVFENVTISNNNTFGPAVLNQSVTPIEINNSVLCGNSVENIAGAHILNNSYLLPNCLSFPGACCIGSDNESFCSESTQPECFSLGGVWAGTNVSCSDSLCQGFDTKGWCCINEESVWIYEVDCDRIGGVFYHENQDRPTCPSSPGDCDGDLTENGTIDFTDLLILINNWGSCEEDQSSMFDVFGTCCINQESLLLFESECNLIEGHFYNDVPENFSCPDNPEICEGDVSGNGTVDFTDLLILINNWGNCPG